MSQIEIVCCCALGDAQVRHHLAPLSQHPLVSRIWLIRTHLPQFFDPQSVRLVPVPRARAARFPAIAVACEKLARRQAVKAYVSFNPFPYGLLALPAARIHGKKVHMGLIGSDWHRASRGLAGPILRKFLQSADMITVTGQAMREQVAEAGVEWARINVLPHAIDLDRFSPEHPESFVYDFIFVGQLIERKRVDRIIDAFALVFARHPESRLCIVGSGPLDGELQRRAAALGIAQAVEFVGYQPDVSTWLKKARIFIMASAVEGLPFALIEAMACGLVPVITPVGSVAEFIEGKGFSVRSGEPWDLANVMCTLLDNGELYLRMRRGCVDSRSRYSYDRAGEVWTPWLEGLAVDTMPSD